jgi:hypothetical protein
MSNYLDEAQVEIVTVDYFRALGYEYIDGPVIAPDGEAPERADYAQVVLTRRLRDAMVRINPDVPVDAIDDALRCRFQIPTRQRAHLARQIESTDCEIDQHVYTLDNLTRNRPTRLHTRQSHRGRNRHCRGGAPGEVSRGSSCRGVPGWLIDRITADVPPPPRCCEEASKP